MRFLDAVSRTGTRKHLVETLLEAQDGPDGTMQSGFDTMVDRSEEA